MPTLRKGLWALVFPHLFTVDGKAINIASMVDEHTRESLLYLVERFITAERLVAELERAFAVGGWPADSAADGQRVRDLKEVNEILKVGSIFCSRR